MHDTLAALTGTEPDAAGSFWRGEAACLTEDPELFFPEGESERYAGQIALAVEICTGCPVRLDCLDYAVRTGQRTGIWGGMTSEQRRRLPATRRTAVAASSDGLGTAAGW